VRYWTLGSDRALLGVYVMEEEADWNSCGGLAGDSLSSDELQLSSTVEGRLRRDMGWLRVLPLNIPTDWLEVVMAGCCCCRCRGGEIIAVWKSPP